jgi:uncharacterized membrane protein YkvA (DUF1232 family)
MSNEFSAAYTDDDFWLKLKKFAKAAGRQVVEAALCLWYAAQRPEVPVWAKATIYSALGYFIVPIDAIPDLVPGGYVDDLGALTLATATIAAYINADVKASAKAKCKDWFGEAAPPSPHDVNEA